MSAPLVFSANPKKRFLHPPPPNTTINNNKHAVSAASMTAAVIKQQLLKAKFPPQGKLFSTFFGQMWVGGNCEIKGF